MPDHKSLDDALRLHREGRIEEAEAAYQQILAAEPDHSGTLHLLGVIRQQQDRHEEALALIGRAIALTGGKEPSPSAPLPEGEGRQGPSPPAPLPKGEGSKSPAPPPLGEGKGKAVYRNNYGAALLSLGRYDEALVSFRKALAISANYPDALANLGPEKGSGVFDLDAREE